MATARARGETLRRGEEGYEAARREALFNARMPDRFPDVIVQANDVYEVVSAVRAAARDGMRVGVRSGGHSWAGNHVRDGGMLLDVSRLDDVRVDPVGMRAQVGPGARGHAVDAELARRGLFFPAGHCRGVALGGYLLQGGFGWHGRTLGMACESVAAIDVVTASGDLVHASEAENPGLYWAARGAGPGFFGVVVRFHLRLYPRPRVIGFAARTYPVDRLEDVYRWAHRVGPEVPASVELQLLLSRHTVGVRGAGITVFAPVFADRIRGALRDLGFLQGAPARPARRVPFVPSGTALMVRGVMQHYPSGYRYAVDNMWTHAGIDELLPGLRRVAETLPPAPSHMLWLNWAPPPERPDMAFSVEDAIYIALYGGWKDPSDDARCATWAVDNVRAMSHLSSGCQLADENLGQHPQRFVRDEHLARLDGLRAEHDPSGRFHPWMGRP